MPRAGEQGAASGKKHARQIVVGVEEGRHDPGGRHERREHIDNEGDGVRDGQPGECRDDSTTALTG